MCYPHVLLRTPSGLFKVSRKDDKVALKKPPHLDPPEDTDMSERIKTSSTAQLEPPNSRFVGFRFDEPAADLRGMHVLGSFGATNAYSCGVYVAVREQAEPAMKQLKKEGVPFVIRTDIDALDFRTGDELARRHGWHSPGGEEGPAVPFETPKPDRPPAVRRGILRWLLG